LRGHLLAGANVWEVVWPGLLTKPDVARPLLTVYDRERPWVALGELPNGSLLAAPLNDSRGTVKWWTPRLQAEDLDFRGSKPSQLELGHIWAVDQSVNRIGVVRESGQIAVEEVIGKYFP
jgi:hypothetical protein